MADKFPPLENEDFDTDVTADQEETDFLKREAELLGDEFKTEEDSEFLQENKNNELENFEEQFPELDNNATASKSEGQPQVDDEDDDFGEPQSAVIQDTKAANSEAITQWKENRDKEISARDASQEKAKSELQEKAVKHMDDFYDTYNRKKEQQLKDTKAEAEKFSKEREGFFKQDNTTWDRVLQLINVDDADLVAGRDRSKFKEILLKLKGNKNAPGA
ncbi:LAQU0S17e00650g1_1 [Lachancea quebecensis]|uniref:Clathrin light chain n=1 Tax=Lachancea quebecensis TaxID=1654605 RepID=A0A0N7MMA0_9SACH|nr:LAQU0S17e00650g1_1 [Lachancea quebecensis]